MLILAISVKDKEFLYNPKTARAVSRNSAEKICSIVNVYNYNLKAGEIWHIHEIDKYDTAAIYAETQKFTIRNGIVKDCRY